MRRALLRAETVKTCRSSASQLSCIQQGSLPGFEVHACHGCCNHGGLDVLKYSTNMSLSPEQEGLGDRPDGLTHDWSRPVEGALVQLPQTT